MSPFPTQLVDRWRDRAEPGPGQGTVYWHVLLGRYPQVRAIAKEAQQRLARFSGLHMTPHKWLHMTTLIVGSTDEVTSDEMDAMVGEAARILSDVDPIEAVLNRVLYHPEAIMLRVDPKDALNPILEAAQSATLAVTGRTGVISGSASWTPHMTLCYSTSQQSAGPIIDVLGKEVPGCRVRINALSLVVQRGGELLWDWYPIGVAHLRRGRLGDQ